jgi:acyl dehydratase
VSTSSTTAADPLRELLLARVGQPLSRAAVAVAPDPVNLTMIRHWVDALDDRNPVYLDDEFARTTRFGAIVAPPAMLQTWTMARPRIEGIAERGGAADEIDPETPVAVLAAAGYPGTLATNSELEFTRYLRLGDDLRSAATLESISERKATALGTGYFVTWVTTYTTVDGEVVGRQRFRILKFAPGEREPGARRRDERPQSGGGAADSSRGPTARAGEELPVFELDVTATVVVAGAIASRDFMPAHHDRDYAQAQGAPDIFMNILTTNGYVARYVTDWAGPEAVLRRIAIRLGAPAIPGRVLRFTGRTTRDARANAERVLEVAVRAANDLGDHATGTVELALP